MTTDHAALRAEIEAEVRASIEAELSALRDAPVPDWLRGTFNFGTYRQAWLWCRGVVRGEHPEPYTVPDDVPAARVETGASS